MAYGTISALIWLVMSNEVACIVSGPKVRKMVISPTQEGKKYRENIVRKVKKKEEERRRKKKKEEAIRSMAVKRT